MATKLEASVDRGRDDRLASRDFEDVVLLVDSHGERFGELEAAPKALTWAVLSTQERPLLILLYRRIRLRRLPGRGTTCTDLTPDTPP